MFLLPSSSQSPVFLGRPSGGASDAESPRRAFKHGWRTAAGGKGGACQPPQLHFVAKPIGPIGVVGVGVSARRWGSGWRREGGGREGVDMKGGRGGGEERCERKGQEGRKGGKERCEKEGGEGRNAGEEKELREPLEGRVESAGGGGARK
ncbi:hypothetical protein Naga_101133g3 [Nannochloropsis gaditana]|uniref:Uncharacterized protein n=1 Tax=Nannochloropsis gaditana TaxID=72520 RepID=W7T9X7_9STRA|nr:hypothetical protein Naga_101133g3 [Nannochloropsis gaditana]